ncbi:MAG TPA: polysaccharide deacetylase, partial [Legionellaceae bacterium]|nr:polysaccharide deacetylase [Legionellaceae bacterium]
MKKLLLNTVMVACLWIHNVYAEKEIALTIDDLPFVGTNSATKGNLQRAHDRFTKILNYLIDANIPATG